MDDVRKETKQFISANVWDGEDRSGCDGDSASFTPDELYELADDLVTYLIEEALKEGISFFQEELKRLEEE